MSDPTFVKLTSAQVLRAVEEAGDAFSKSERDALAKLIPLVENPSSETTVAEAMEMLYGTTPDAETATELNRFRKFRLRLADGTEEANGLRIGVAETKNRSNSKRPLWFEAYAHAVETWLAEAADQTLAGHREEWVVPQTARLLNSDGTLTRPRIGFAFESGDVKARKFLGLLKGEAARLQEPWNVVSQEVMVGEAKVGGWALLSECDIVLVWLGDNAFDPEHRAAIEQLVESRKGRVWSVNRGHHDRARHDLGKLRPLPMLGEELDAKKLFASEERALIHVFLSRLADGSAMASEAKEGEVLFDVACLERLALELGQDQGFVPSKGSAFKDLSQISDVLRAGQGEDALHLLIKWRDDVDSSPYYAVLGEAGIGKTTLLRQFAKISANNREATPAVPMVIYLDLRKYSQAVHEGRVPDAEELLGELLKESVVAGNKQELTAGKVLDLVQKGAILIMDGLDEKLTHLTPSQGQALVQRIWSIAPPFVDPKTGQRPRKGRIVVSCRSHFFATLREQNAFLTSQYRDNIKASHYEAMVLLPFDEGQVLTYFTQVMGLSSEGAEKAVETVKSIHNLEELSRRPMLLSLIAPQIESLERSRADGIRVRSIDLYQNLVKDWIARDDGKHQIRESDKRRLMPRLAAAMWKEGAREWPWNRIDDWFTEQLADDRKLLYDPKEIPVLQEDLRNATFIVRGGASQDLFRFAHTSLQEFFLAQSLLEALNPLITEKWAGPLPSDETFAFLSEMLEETPSRRRGIVELLESPNGDATRAALKYFLLARENGWPLAQPDRFELGGLDLYGWIFRGTWEEPLNLRRANLSGADLTATEWKYVNLQGADLRCSRAAAALFDAVSLELSELDGLEGDMSIWRSSTAPREKPAKGRFSRVPDRLRNLAPSVTGALGVVRSVAFSADGRWLLTGGLSGARLWDVETGRSVRGLAGAAISVAFSRDGRWLLTGGGLGAQIWDAETGCLARGLEGALGGVNSVAFSPDGRWLLTGGLSGAQLWDAETGCLVRGLEGAGEVFSVAFSPDGRRLFTGGLGGAQLWDAETARSIPGPAAAGWVRSVAVSPDGRWLLTGGRSGAQIWDAETGCLVRGLMGAGAVFSVAFSPDGRWLLTGGLSGGQLWNAETGGLVRGLAGAGWVNSVVFSPDGNWLLTGGDRGAQLWGAETGRLARGLAGAHEVRAVAFPPGGHWLLTGGGRGAQLWDTETGGSVRRFSGIGEVRSVAFSRDGGWMFTGGDRGAQLWDLEAGTSLRGLSGAGAVFSVAFSPDGNWLLTGGDRGAQLWDAETGGSVRRLSGADAVFSVAFSPDGRWLLTGGDRGAQLWDAETGGSVCGLAGAGEVRSVAFSPNGRWLLTGGVRGAQLWETETGSLVRRLVGAGAVFSVAFSPDGHWLLTGGESGAQLWDAQSGTSLRGLEGALGGVNSVAFSPDGRWLLTGGQTGAQLWDVNTGELRLGIVTGDPVRAAAIDYTQNRFLYFGDETWRVAGWVGVDEENLVQWLMPEEYEGGWQWQ